MIWSNMLRRIGTHLARYLSKPRDESRLSTSRAGDLAASLQKGDVLLVEGTSRFSSAIKYLTQSSWSHAALYIGDALNGADDTDEGLNLIEADVIEGVRAVPLKEYESIHTRICRPKGLAREEIDKVLHYVIDRMGHTYDLKNIFDLVRYLLQHHLYPADGNAACLPLAAVTPPVPSVHQSLPKHFNLFTTPYCPILNC